jgi:uncharacterized protein (DUF1330 family)
MSVYLIVEIEIEDENLYSRYVEGVADVVHGHGGRYLARGGSVTPVSGGWVPERVVLIEFDTAEQVERCFSSPEYARLAPLRERSTKSRAIVVQGCSSRESPAEYGSEETP